MAKPFLVPNPFSTMFDNSGVLVASGGKVFTYQAGTTTKLNTYPTSADALAGTTASAGDGFNIKIKKIDSSANTVTITPNGAETWDGASTYVLSAQYQYAEGYSDGVSWIQGPGSSVSTNLTRMMGSFSQSFAFS